MDESKKNVFKIYNVIADWFSQNRPQDLAEKPYLDKLIEMIGTGASVLDLGCGTGKPILGYLLEKKMQVVGVDASHRMLAIAKDHFPAGNFVQMDMRQLSLNRTFDAIICWNSFFHLPAEDQPPMFGIFKEHLNPNGVLLFTSGNEWGEAWGMNGGENLFHASLNKEDYQKLLRTHGFELLLYRKDDPGCGNATVWMAGNRSL